MEALERYYTWDRPSSVDKRAEARRKGLICSDRRDGIKCWPLHIRLANSVVFYDLSVNNELNNI